MTSETQKYWELCKDNVGHLYLFFEKSSFFVQLSSELFGSKCLHVNYFLYYDSNASSVIINYDTH